MSSAVQVSLFDSEPAPATHWQDYSQPLTEPSVPELQPSGKRAQLRDLTPGTAFVQPATGLHGKLVQCHGDSYATVIIYRRRAERVFTPYGKDPVVIPAGETGKPTQWSVGTTVEVIQ